VTTPQAVALVDARKGVDMFQNEKINVPVLGLVENMAWFTPAELPENRYYIFGKDGGKELADELNIPLLGQLPLVQSIREGGDEGMPIALQDGHPAAAMFEAIVDKLENQ
jgi:ATP-binding protein involved in chromosome partitioning